MSNQEYYEESLKFDSDYEDNLLKHGYQKVESKEGYIYYVKGITNKREIQRIESIKKANSITWDVSTKELFITAFTEHSLISYLEEIKPYSSNWEYFE